MFQTIVIRLAKLHAPVPARAGLVRSHGAAALGNGLSEIIRALNALIEARFSQPQQALRHPRFFFDSTAVCAVAKATGAVKMSEAGEVAAANGQRLRWPPAVGE